VAPKPPVGDIIVPPTALERAAKFYRPARWVVFALSILAILLILHKGTPPPVSVDPDAAARAAEKIRVSDAQAAAGQPHQLQLDHIELNSFLNENLAINGRTEPGAPANGAAPGLATGPITPPNAGQPGANANANANANAAPSGNAANSPNGPNAAAPTLEEVQSAVKDVKVDMVGDLVKAYVVFNFHGEDLSLELDGHVRAENGYLKFDPVSGALGSLPLPPGTLQSAAQRMFDSPENREKMKLPEGVSDIQIVDSTVVVTYTK
jgi:hypothetical protein